MGSPPFTMKFFLTIFLATATSASVLPLKFKFGSHSPVLKGVSQCPGFGDATLVFVDGSMPDKMCMPSTNTVDLHSIIKEDLPTDLKMFLDLKKLTPFEMKVPCLNGVGSCEYDMCEMIENSADTLCPIFSPSQPCGCPLLAGDMDLKGVTMEIQDMGSILGPVMEGGYWANATMYGTSNPEKLLGCVIFEFELELC